MVFEEMWLHGSCQLSLWEIIHLNFYVFKMLMEEVQVHWKIIHGSRSVADV
jgi:hypothetical protein